MKFLKDLEKQTKKYKATVILPEANIDERVLKAAAYCLKKDIVKVVVFGKEQQFPKLFKNSENCKIIDIEKTKNLTDFANQLFELRKDKGLTLQQAKSLFKHPGYYACMMIKNKLADGMIVGAKFTTAESIRPALQIIKADKNSKFVTGSTLMVKNNEKPFILGDVSLIEKPDAEKLANIAVLNAEFMKNVLNIQPRVAMLSYSTKGSAESDMVEIVRSATKIAKKSKHIIDGEMQLDCAVDAEVARRKGIDNQVGGKANVFIFPDLNAGNICYKAISRFAKYAALGPIMIGMDAPVNDLSRGSTWQEIVDTIIITKLQVIHNKNALKK